MAENQALKTRVGQLEQLSVAAARAPYPHIVAIPPSEVSRPSTSASQPDSSALPRSESQTTAADSTPRQPSLAIDVNIPPACSPSTTSSEVSIPLASTIRRPQQQAPTPDPSSPANQQQQLPPPDPCSPPRSAKLEEDASPALPPPASCQCPTFVVVSPSRRAVLNAQEEPTRARNWLETVFAATDVNGPTTIAQAEMYNMYKALDKDSTLKPRVVLGPPAFFALLKTVFPAAKCVQNVGPSGGGAYVIRGLTWRKAACVCGLRAS
ncbi:hypothetical protein AURDEDRAFT_166039 [Auricularia subglabra TFB-10046 SS5]|nr:hypothetical protein AURDEDRAFT_166039 [Auricularia subglabra TFB-10046 SS5]